jgi:hypothetical protein
MNIVLLIIGIVLIGISFIVDSELTLISYLFKVFPFISGLYLIVYYIVVTA